jgi:hypothetical protein
MFTRTLVIPRLVLVFWSTCLLGQQKPAASASLRLLEFPVVLQQNVETGKTQVGTKIQAKLAVATLVNGMVIPQNATLSGLVIESVAKTAADPARLAIRMESLEWKNGSASIKAYLTPWYYPKAIQMGQSLQYGPLEPPSKTWNGAGQYPSADSRVYQPFPGSDSDKSAGSVPDTPSSTTSNRPVLMKNVGTAPSLDGGIALVSEHANLKLDKLTTYVLAASGPPAK